MSHFELCGFKADQHGAFPIEAYYAFCEKRGIPFPFDWQPKGQKKGIYTIEQAVLKIMELTPENVEHDEHGALIFEGVARCLELFFIGKVCFDEKRCEASLGSYTVENPFNYGKAWDLSFPREAFFEVWTVERNGLPLPGWFADLDEAEAERQFYEGIAEPVQSTAPVVPAPSPDDTVVVDDLTVVALRKVFDHSPALRDIVKAVAEVQAMPRDGVQKPSENTIKARINLKAKAHGWGTADDGSLAGTQWTGLKTIVLGRGNGGRPKKEAKRKTP